MLFFRNAEDVSGWSRRHGLPVGDVQPLSKVWELAKRWYGDYLRLDWSKRSIQEALAIFKELGFSHPVWNLGSAGGRF